MSKSIATVSSESLYVAQANEVREPIHLRAIRRATNVSQHPESDKGHRLYHPGNPPRRFGATAAFEHATVNLGVE